MQPFSALLVLLLVLSRALAVPVSSNGHHVRLDVGEDGSTVDAISSRWTIASPEPVSAKTYKAIKFTQSIDENLAPVNGTTLDLDILDFHTPIDIPATLHRNLLKTPKFFVEDGNDPHIAANLDTLRMEMGKTSPSSAVTVDSLRHLARNLTEFSILHDWVYWLAHGTLLGEKWGSKILSFDDDLDVQTSYLGLYKLLPQHNKIFNNRYLFQINPWIVQRLSLNNAKYINMARIESRIPEKNVIDARFLDVETGLFVDITALSAEAADDGWYDTEEGRLLADHNERLHDKSIHTYRFTDISPLHSCEFEGLPAWCPHKADRILVDEYKYESGNPHYETFRFNAEQKTFEELNCTALAQLYTKPTSKTCDSACRKIVQHERQIKWVKDAQSPDECLLNVRVKKLMGEGIELHEDFKFRGRRTTLELPELP